MAAGKQAGETLSQMLAGAAAPFKQGRFEDLPEAPRVPHGYFAAEARTLTVSGRRVHVRVHGAGPPLLLVHGLMTSSYSWRYALPALGAHFTLYAPDLPGAGASEPLDTRYSPERLADWLAELLRALGISGCAAIGNSMGGYLCLQLALREPTALSRLVDVHSPGIVEPRLFALAAALGVPGAHRLLHWLVRRDPLRWAHRNVHYYDETLKSLEEAREYGSALDRPGGAESFGKYLGETMAVLPMRRFQRELRARRARGRAFPIPLLLLYSERDPMVPARFGDDFARLIPSARLERVREASHFMHVDAVERFLAPTLQFLSPEPAPPRAG